MSRVTDDLPILEPGFPPTAIQAEQILLGRLIRDGAHALTEIGTLTPDQFADPLHGDLYRAVVRLIEAAQPIDAKALAEVAEESGILDDVGGAAYLQHLATLANDPPPIAEAADLVRVAWTGRQAMADRAEGRRIPDARDHRASVQHPIHCMLFGIELETLAERHDETAGDLRRAGDGEAADLMEARAAELRRLAARARAGR